MTAPDRDRAVRRNTRLLLFAQALSQVSLAPLLLVGGPAVAKFSGSTTVAGLFLATYFGSAAAGALFTGRWMDRVGRRPGLLLGCGLLALGALVAAGGASMTSWVVLVIASIPYGAGAGSVLLARVAVADMYPPERRGKAVGWMLAAGTFGAVAGAPLVGLIQERSNESFVTPWLVVPVFMAGAAALFGGLRPDPRDLAVVTHAASEEAHGQHRGPSVLVRTQAPYRAALVSTAVGQVAMVGVMGVTPLAMGARHASHLSISLTISLHVIGMFALGPILGSLFDRFGRRPGLLGGAAVSATGAIVAGTAPSAELIALGLFLVGLGWSSAFLASTATVSDVTTPRERGGALGFMDLFVSLASAAGALAAGALFDLAGFKLVAMIMASTLAIGLVVTLRTREVAPGTWE